MNSTLSVIREFKKDNPNTPLPIAVSNNICVKDMCTTASSMILENFIPPYDATVIEKLKSQGFTNPMYVNFSLDEFGIGNYLECAEHVMNCNYKLAKECGISNSSIAVWLMGAIASDSGGAVRVSAAKHGLTGLLPTYGRVSRYGLIAFASSMEQIGVIAHNAEDCGIILNAIAGYDPADGTSAKVDVPDFTSKIGLDIKGLKIGYFNIDCVSVLNTAQELERMGTELVKCDLPNTRTFSRAVHLILSSAEAASNLSRYDGIKFGHRASEYGDWKELIINSRTEGFGEEVMTRIMFGNYVLSKDNYDAYYKKALAVRQLIKDEFTEAFKTCDVIITPTSVSPEIANLAGLPAISIPLGQGTALTIIGKPFEEATIIGVADAFEKRRCE